MPLVNLPENRSVTAVERLSSCLIAVMGESKQMLNLLKELAEYEYIAPDDYKRMVDSEFLQVTKKVQDLLYICRGVN